MIRRVSGTIVGREPLFVVIDIGGLGYQVFVPRLTTTYTVGTECTLLTHLAVRENALDLYGFETEAELDLFELLLTLPKIGPKSALQILTQAEPTIIEQAVAQEDAGYLSKLTGLGKKTAEKVVEGLKDKLVFSPQQAVAQEASFVTDAIDALVALGYPQSDARRAVLQLPPSVTTATEAVRESLKILG